MNSTDAMQHTAKQWFITTRPWSFTASAMPVITVVCYLMVKAYGHINWWLALGGLFCAVVFHAATNLHSDISDFKTGVDSASKSGATSMTNDGYTPQEIRRLSNVLFAIGIVAGLTLCIFAGWQLLVIGVLGSAIAVGYPYLKARALGDFDIFMTFCILPALGMSYLVVGKLDFSVLLPAVPCGLMVVAILHSNNTRDYKADGDAGLTTFAKVLGTVPSFYYYCALTIVIPFLWVIALCIAGIFPLASLAVLLALPLVIRNVIQFRRFAVKHEGDIENLDLGTAQAQMIFCLLFALSFVAAYIF